MKVLMNSRQMMPPAPQLVPSHPALPTLLCLFVRRQLRPFDYDVIVLYDQDEEDVDPGPLLTAPTFWTGESACDGAVPVPDASWVSLDYLRVGGL